MKHRINNETTSMLQVDRQLECFASIFFGLMRVPKNNHLVNFIRREGGILRLNQPCRMMVNILLLSSFSSKSMFYPGVSISYVYTINRGTGVFSREATGRTCVEKMCMAQSTGSREYISLRHLPRDSQKPSLTSDACRRIRLVA
jgi:hypothetical protein